MNTATRVKQMPGIAKSLDCCGRDCCCAGTTGGPIAAGMTTVRVDGGALVRHEF
jgi:hypothetical protein